MAPRGGGCGPGPLVTYPVDEDEYCSCGHIADAHNSIRRRYDDVCVGDETCLCPRFQRWSYDSMQVTREGAST